MSRLVRRIAWAALGYVVVSLLRQRTTGSGRRRHHPLETWENEGGAMG